MGMDSPGAGTSRVGVRCYEIVAGSEFENPYLEIFEIVKQKLIFFLN